MFCIPKILKNESNSQRSRRSTCRLQSCFVSQRYWKMKAIHNNRRFDDFLAIVVLYPKDTEKWKQFTTVDLFLFFVHLLFCIPKILKNESNSQRLKRNAFSIEGCFVSQRYWKMKAIHNNAPASSNASSVVLYPKDTEKWKQFTTSHYYQFLTGSLFCIPKILKNESNSQREKRVENSLCGCFVSQRYWKMKAIHNSPVRTSFAIFVVLYPKDTEKWKQFTTKIIYTLKKWKLFCIPKILKNESNSQLFVLLCHQVRVVLYPKDTEKWKQFTTRISSALRLVLLFCIPKILKNESNSQLKGTTKIFLNCCFVSQRYWKMKAIHNVQWTFPSFPKVVLYPKDTEKWKQFTTQLSDWCNLTLLFCIPKILKNEI